MFETTPKILTQVQTNYTFLVLYTKTLIVCRTLFLISMSIFCSFEGLAKYRTQNSPPIFQNK